MELIDKQVTLFVGDQIKAHFPHIESVVVNELDPLPALSAAEPISYTPGVVSSFLSPASPLVEAIESTARVVADLEIQDCHSGRPDRLAALGAMSVHLEILLSEQRIQLCAAVKAPSCLQ